MVTSTVRSGRRMTDCVKPLFPGYVFVYLDPLRSRWRAVDSTYGVRSLVKCGELPAPLPHGCVEALIDMSNAQGLVTFTSSLNLGEDVKFLSGPFAGFIGKLAQLDAGGRVTVLLELLGRATPVRGQANELIPA